MHRKSCSPEATSAAGSWHTNGAPGAFAPPGNGCADAVAAAALCTVPAQAADFPSSR